jgi:hypothetical protein
MVFLQYVNLALRFLLELCALAALGYWGFQTGKGWVMKIGLGIGIPVLIAVIWGMFGSPGASVKLSAPLHLLLELVIFGLPAIALYAAGKHGLAGSFILTVVINRILMYMWGQ